MTTPKAGPNSAAPTTAEVVGGVYNATQPALNDGQATALQTDASGNLKVNVVTGGGSSNVNIADVAGSPPALNNPLPVELSDGTNAFGTSGNPLSENVAQWGGTAVQSAQTTSTDGTGANPVVRNIPRRFGQILTTTPLAANGVFTSAWFDTNQTGDVAVEATAFSNVASAASGFIIQETDDTTNSNSLTNITASATSVFGGGLTVNASVLGVIYGAVKKRYWRVTYTNGGAIQASFEVTASTASVTQPVVLASNSTLAGTPVSVPSSAGGNVQGDGDAGFPIVLVGSSGTFNGRTYPVVFNGATWDRPRTPNIFKTVQATASGNTALWTPTSGKKFRLMRFILDLTSNANLAAGAVVTISFQDSTTAMNIAFDVFIPTTAVTTGFGGYTSGWVDLGNGFLSAAANNVLNVNLSAAITTGNVRVTCCGTEE